MVLRVKGWGSFTEAPGKTWESDFVHTLAKTTNNKAQHITIIMCAKGWVTGENKNDRHGKTYPFPNAFVFPPNPKS